MAIVKGVMRQLEEKYCRSKISHLVWSNKLDLIAVASTAGEVTLHRLNWQRVWHLPPPDVNVFVKMIAWRPDGRVIAIAYDNREILLVNLEKCITNKMCMPDDVCYLHWVDEETAFDRAKDYYFVMNGCKYVTKLTPFTGSDGNEIPEETFVKLEEQKTVNFLLIGLSSGDIKISIYGLILCGTISIQKSLGIESSCKIVFIGITKNLKNLYTIFEINNNNGCKELHCVMYDTPQLDAYSQDLYILAHHSANIFRLIDYMDCSIKSIVEAWESILLNEMMLKLGEYARNEEMGTLSTELLELLMFGSYNENMQQFLMKELSDKHLKRISGSIEMSHSSMLKFVMQHLRPCFENLLFELTILKGVVTTCTRTRYRDISHEIIENSITAIVAFYVKSNEMLGVLEESQVKYKSFFRWLTTIFSSLLGERVPSNAADITQRELKFITKYLENIDRLTGGQPDFEKEELGQFLVDQDLTNSAQRDITNNTWIRLLEDNPQLLEGFPSFISTKFRKFSLIQQQNYFKKQIDEFFDCFKDYVSTKYNVKSHCLLTTVPVTEIINKIVASVSGEQLYLSMIKSQEDNKKSFLKIFSIREKNNKFSNTSLTLVFDDDDIGTDPCYKILDLAFYTDNVLSVLLDKSDDEHEHSYYTQVPIEMVQHLFHTSEIKQELSEAKYINIFRLLNKDLRAIENMKVSRIAVSGARKVLVVISDDGHKVRIFEMEFEEEEDVVNATNSSGNVTEFIISPKVDSTSRDDHRATSSRIINDSCRSLLNDRKSLALLTAEDSEMSLDISHLTISPIQLDASLRRTDEENSSFDSLLDLD